MNNLNEKTDIEVDIEVIDKGNFFNLKEPYKTKLTIIELGNLAQEILNLADGYAYELDTSVDNLDMKITNLKIIKQWKE